jgi:tetratricopeptide (TPR) repeat protein
MNKISSLLFFVLLFSCSSPTTRQNSKVVSNNDFKKSPTYIYQSGKDYHSSKSDTSFQSMSDESLNRISPNNNSEINENDILSTMIDLCYKKKFNQAFELARTHTNQMMKVPTFWNQLGTCYLLNGKERKALLYFNKALELAPQYTPSLNNYGLIYLKQNSDQKALAAFIKSLESKKFAKTPRFNMAQLLLSYGLADEALPIFRSLISQAPQDVDILSGLANSYFLLGDSRQSIEFFKQIPEKFHERPDIGINYSKALFESGAKDQALEKIENVNKPKNLEYQKYYQETFDLIKGKL